MLWVALYVVLAPLALVAVPVKPGAQGPPVVFAAGLGFAGLSLLVLQMLVSGRWRAITASFGLRAVLSLHRQAGTAALVLVIGHVVALMADDPARLALLDPREAPLRARAGMAAVLAMLALVATSVWRRRMRLSYERWRAIHVVCAAIVIAGSFVHVAGVSAYGNRLIGYDPDRRRLWLLGQRVHHGLAGALLAATGTLLMARLEGSPDVVPARRRHAAKGPRSPIVAPARCRGTGTEEGGGPLRAAAAPAARRARARRGRRAPRPARARSAHRR